MTWLFAECSSRHRNQQATASVSGRSHHLWLRGFAPRHLAYGMHSVSFFVAWSSICAISITGHRRFVVRAELEYKRLVVYKDNKVRAPAWYDTGEVDLIRTCPTEHVLPACEGASSSSTSTYTCLMLEQMKLCYHSSKSDPHSAASPGLISCVNYLFIYGTLRCEIIVSIEIRFNLVQLLRWIDYF